MQKRAGNNAHFKTPQIRRARRTLFLVIILASIALYFPINRIAQNGVQLSLPIDRQIPFYPPFIIPYLSGTLLFIGVPVWAAIRAGPGDFEDYTISILLAIWVSYIVYIVLPTYVSRPEVVSKDIFSKVMEILYGIDRAYNAAPSGHAIYSTLSFLYLIRWVPRYKFIWLASWITILASALFTRQHNVLDIVS